MKIQLVPNELLRRRSSSWKSGGAGGNAINDMITSQMAGVDLIAAKHSYAQALERSLAPVKIQLGPNLGLGAGGDPEMGKKAALEDAERLQQVLQGCDMVFIAAGLGGGTGTGGAPIGGGSPAGDWGR